MKFLDPRETESYVLESERSLKIPEGADPVERAKIEEINTQRVATRTTFTLGLMSIREWSAILDNTQGEDGGIRSGTIHRLRLRYGLRGWEGPEAPPFVVATEGLEKGHPTDETLSRLPKDTVLELSDAIHAFSNLNRRNLGK